MHHSAAPLGRRGTRRPRLLAAAATASALALAGALTWPVGASALSRVALPDPTPGWAAGTPTALAPDQALTLRVYLSGRDPAGRVARALAVSDPAGPAYSQYLTPAEYRERYGSTTAQTSAVSAWLTSQGMAITATNQHYLTVDATVRQADAAFDTEIAEYDFGVVGAVGGFSVPDVLGADVATVTGLDEVVIPAAGAAAAQTTRKPVTATAAPSSALATSSKSQASGYKCSQYWGQHNESIPEAYGRTSAPTQLCGYTVAQMRDAYGISSSPYAGKGATIAIVLDGSSPAALSDANRFFASQGVAGFAPGQYSENFDSSFASSCDGNDDEPEESLDVETVHIAAPDAKVVYVGADCGTTEAGQQQDLLDAMTRVVDKHLADVVTESYSVEEQEFSAADAAAWNLTFQQGALEGIGFDFDSGDGGDNLGALPGDQTSVTFPASDPWATAVGGTNLEIGPKRVPVAEYGWGDNATEVDSAGTGYTSPPPGSFLEGSTGGLSALFAEPAYQEAAVPAALATDGGTEPAHRVVPDIAADAGSVWLIGYTGAVTPGVYSVIPEGGTSGATPLIAGLEADAMQADGHPLGFVNPALYLLYRTKAIHDVLPVNPDHPPILIGSQPFLGSATDYLTTLGEDSSLQAAAGYDDVTGLGSPSRSFVTAFRRH